MGSARPGSNPGDCDTKPWGPLPSSHESKEDPARAAVMSERLRSQTRTSRVSVETKTDGHGSTRQALSFLPFAHGVGRHEKREESTYTPRAWRMGAKEAACDG